jgi:heme-degrading monooxygenase HmoA
MTYLRVTVASWGIDLCAEEGEKIFQMINESGVKVLKALPGFIHYRMMRSDRHTTMSVAEWRSEAYGREGAKAFLQWMREERISRQGRPGGLRGRGSGLVLMPLGPGVKVIRS